MVWGCFTGQGIGKLCVFNRIMDRFYHRDILERQLQSSINHFKIGERCVFMHDNIPRY